jgi:hypothetical protein
MCTKSYAFCHFWHFFINKDGLCFGFFTYLTLSDLEYNSDILYTVTEVGGTILECPLNSPFRPSYGHFTNGICSFSSYNSPHFFTSQQQASFSVSSVPWQRPSDSNNNTSIKEWLQPSLSIGITTTKSDLPGQQSALWRTSQ